MTEGLKLFLALLAGLSLGAFFFGGLWWTVQRGLSSRKPGLWFIGSSLLRTAVVLGGLYLVSGGRWERLLACVAGFFLARASVIRLTSGANGKGDSKREDRHASQFR